MTKKSSSALVKNHRYAHIINTHISTHTSLNEEAAAPEGHLLELI